MMTKDEMDYVFDNVRHELERMNAAKKNQVTQSQNHFANWVRNAVNNIGRAIGYVISLPFKAIGALWNWLFG